MSKVHPLYCAGEWKLTDSVLDVFSPDDYSLVGSVATADEKLLTECIGKLYDAREVMSNLSIHQRVSILNHLTELLEANHEKIAYSICEEAGKPIRDARNEARRSELTLRSTAAALTEQKWDAFPLDHAPGSEGRWGIVRRFPIGVVAGISPFNYPLNLVCHKLAPALAAGCPFLLKPASTTPLTALLLAELALEAGFPPEGLAVLPCSGAVAENLARDERIAMITFTGSPQVGWHLRSLAPRKKFTLELGGNAATIVWDDSDLAYAIPRLVMGSFVYAGQVCIKIQRIIIASGVYEEVKSRLIEKTTALCVGTPRDAKTEVGPMISEKEAKRAEDWLADAVAGGARILCGGERINGYLKPTLVENCPRDARLYRDEAFAPVTVLETADTFDEALKKANDTVFGLQCGVFTRDIRRIEKACRVLEVGGVIIGDVSTYRIDPMPYGGEKDSGVGREGPRYAIEEMCRHTVTVMNAPHTTSM